MDAAVPALTVALSKINLQLAERLAELHQASPPETRANRLGQLSIALSALGQPEKALAAVQQAVDLYRELARQRPDAFTPNWATSLIVLALQVEKLQGAASALVHARAAVEALAPAFLARPQAHAGLMLAMLKDYVRLCQAANMEPDVELLAPLLPFFQPPSPGENP